MRAVRRFMTAWQTRHIETASRMSGNGSAEESGSQNNERAVCAASRVCVGEWMSSVNYR